jgi:hypothetical protein
MTIFNSLRKFVGIITAVVTFAAATTVNISQKQSNVAYNTPHTTEVATIPIDQPQVEQDTTVKETPAKYDPTIKVRISPDNKVTIVKSPESETEATKQTDKADTLTSPNPQLFKTIPNGINIDFGQKAEAYSFADFGANLTTVNGNDLKDQVIYDIDNDKGHTILHKTWWGYYYDLDKKATIHTIREMEKVGNYSDFTSFSSFVGTIIGKLGVPGGVVTVITGAYSKVVLPEAISEANFCLNTTERSYLKFYKTGAFEVSCN